MATFAQRIKQLRKEKNLKQQQLADQFSVSCVPTRAMNTASPIRKWPSWWLSPTSLTSAWTI